MNIAYYMPFKPMGHPNPSGDLVTGTELYNFLEGKGHTIEQVSRFRCRWLYLKPWKLVQLPLEIKKSMNRCRILRPDIWLSYHSYYKAPDFFGPVCSRRLNIPYILFQGIYSTKRRRSMKTWPGFWLNRRVLLAARMVFTNKRADRHNLLRLLPPDRVCYVPPGIHPEAYRFDQKARQDLRESWQVGRQPVVFTAAMFRPGVKADGIREVIRSCAVLSAQGTGLKLVVAGDGAERDALLREAERALPGAVRFVGKISRPEMYRYYSAADLFAFPGVQESLGMVYLEAQSCGLPVVAYREWGASEAVIHGRTGLLATAADKETLTANIEQLVLDKDLRKKMGQAAGEHVRKTHDLEKNYTIIEQTLQDIS